MPKMSLPLALPFLLVVLLVVLPASAQDQGSLREAESKAIARLRLYASAEATYHSTHDRFATLSELVDAKYLDEGSGEGSEQGGYRFSTTEVGKDTFDIRAEPTTPDAGRYSFNVIQDHTIRFENGAKAPKRAEGKVVGRSRSGR